MMRIPVLEVGGTHVTGGYAAGLDSAEPTAEVSTRLPLDAAGSADELLDSIAEVLDQVPWPASTRCGVALPGPFDYATGVARYADVGKFDSLFGVDVRAALAARSGREGASFAFVNDAHACAHGERLAGAAQGAHRFILLTLGTGVGSAFVEGETVLTVGARVPPEGRVDLLTIDGRPLEDTVSRRAVLARFAAGDGRRPLDVVDVARLARAGNEHAFESLSEPLHRLGDALAPWVQRFVPEVIVVGGSIAGSWGIVEHALAAGLGQLSATTRVAPAVLGERAALLGAGWYAGRVT